MLYGFNEDKSISNIVKDEILTRESGEGNAAFFARWLKRVVTLLDAGAVIDNIAYVNYTNNLLVAYKPTRYFKPENVGQQVLQRRNYEFARVDCTYPSNDFIPSTVSSMSVSKIEVECGSNSHGVIQNIWAHIIDFSIKYNPSSQTTPEVASSDKNMLDDAYYYPHDDLRIRYIL